MVDSNNFSETAGKANCLNPLIYMMGGLLWGGRRRRRVFCRWGDWAGYWIWFKVGFSVRSLIKRSNLQWVVLARWAGRFRSWPPLRFDSTRNDPYYSPQCRLLCSIGSLYLRSALQTESLRLLFCQWGCSSCFWRAGPRAVCAKAISQKPNRGDA